MVKCKRVYCGEGCPRGIYEFFLSSIGSTKSKKEEGQNKEGGVLLAFAKEYNCFLLLRKPLQSYLL